RDVGVMARDVLPQEGRVHTERDGGAVLDDALGYLGQDVGRTVPCVELGAGQTAGHQRDDDEDDQNDRLPIAKG
ncbi:MAG: hypothetical protein QOD39_157, partial [Mycobacterium sp.]|nr:hypothetical protein [Mycobacterium sp.]